MRILIFLILFWGLSDALHFAFGSKSNYKFENDLEEPEQCEISSLFFVSRHGSRYPTLKHLNKYSKLTTKIISLNWTHSFSVQDEGLLTSKGEIEMKELGKRLRLKYPSLFLKHPRYHPRIFEFKASQSPRALQSASAFAFGMFGTDRAFVIESESVEKDIHLRFHDNCERYQKHKKMRTPNLDHLVLKIVDKIRHRYSLGHEFDASAVETLWSGCIFEATALEKFDGACSYFNEDDAMLLEYVQDVKDYWEKSFGQSLNYEMSCKLLEAAISTLEAARFKFLFGHAETIIPFLSLLGFYKDKNHIGNDFELDQLRKFRLSKVSPFAANIGLAVKKCDGISFIEIRHNEKLMDISHLCGSGSTAPRYNCSFEEFRRNINKKITSCEFKQMCTVQD